jgi:hypothetical protein
MATAAKTTMSIEIQTGCDFLMVFCLLTLTRKQRRHPTLVAVVALVERTFVITQINAQLDRLGCASFLRGIDSYGTYNLQSASFNCMACIGSTNAHWFLALVQRAISDLR